jgi:hypothetical protein
MRTRGVGAQELRENAVVARMQRGQREGDDACVERWQHGCQLTVPQNLGLHSGPDVL